MNCCQYVYMERHKIINIYNKYLNSIISKRCPKYIFVGRTTLSMGVSSAVILILILIMGHMGYSKLCRNMD